METCIIPVEEIQLCDWRSSSSAFVMVQLKIKLRTKSLETEMLPYIGKPVINGFIKLGFLQTLDVPLQNAELVRELNTITTY